MAKYGKIVAGFSFEAPKIYGGATMKETYSTLKENGYDYALSIAGELRSQGYEILRPPYEALVPRGQRNDGSPVMVPGYKIEVDDGRPPYAPIVAE